MSTFQEAVARLAYFAKKADVVGGLRLSITFSNERERQHFLMELQRELAGLIEHGGRSLGRLDYEDFHINGITIRIL